MQKFILLSLTAVLLLSTAAVFAQPEVIVHHKINVHSQSPNHIEFSATTGGTAATSPLLYHNGPLINTPTIYIIWYGNWNRGNGTDTPAGQQLIRDWASGIGNSQWFQINQSKSVTGKSISGNVNPANCSLIV